MPSIDGRWRLGPGRSAVLLFQKGLTGGFAAAFDQGSGVIGLRVREEVVREPFFHDPAAPHDDHAVAYGADDGQVIVTRNRPI